MYGTTYGQRTAAWGHIWSISWLSTVPIEPGLGGCRYFSITLQLLHLGFSCTQWLCSHHKGAVLADWATSCLNCYLHTCGFQRGVGNERNLVHLVEKSVEIKLKSREIEADFLEIRLGNQPNPPAPPTFTTYDVIFEGNHGEIKEKSGNLVRPKLLVADPSASSQHVPVM